MKILIIRFSSIGDIVLTTPVIRCLKNQLANSEIHFLTKNAFLEILEANPYVSKIYGIDKDISEIAELLKNENYDLIIDLHNNIRSRQVSIALKAKTVRYNKKSFQRFMLTKFKINLLNDHVVDRYFSAVKKLNILNDGKGLDYYIPERDEVPVQKLPFTHLAGYCVIVVGAKHFTKTIPVVKLEELCAKISIPIILIGGLDDAYTGTHLESIDKFKIWNACGRYNINQSASVIKKAKFVITGDTGMMHIAAAFQKRIISIWGGTDKRLGFTPYSVSGVNAVIIENTSLNCRPCHKYGLAKCPLGHFKCMLDLDMQKVMDVL